MDFGRVLDSKLENVDFSLPVDHPDTSVILESSSNDGLEIYIGCAKWGRPDWVGKLYPKGTKARDFLSYYAKEFNSIELNPTYHRFPDVSLIKKWVNLVPQDFLFCPKVYQGISHFGRLKNQEESTRSFCEAIRHFGAHLGTVFLQLHPNFSPKNYDTLEAYINQWPEDIPLALELRDKGWFVPGNASDQLFHLMRERNTTAIITDTAGYRELVHMRLSTNQAFIRFVGNSLHPSDYKRIDDWVIRICEWMEQGLNKLWFFMHQHEELHSPELIRYMALEMKSKLGLNVKVPHLHSDQASLF